jgi:hypothetical protein
MLALGLVLVVLAALVLVAAIAGGADDSAHYYVGSLQVDLSTMAVFLLGAATLLVFVIGLELTRSGLRRANRRRKEDRTNRRVREGRPSGERASTSATEPAEDDPRQPGH